MFLVASEISKDISSEIELQKNILQVRLRKFFSCSSDALWIFTKNSAVV
jgi:hypothetical protein